MSWGKYILQNDNFSNIISQCSDYFYYIYYKYSSFWFSGRYLGGFI